MKPKYSIIIRTKNEERYIEKVLQSIYSQDTSDFEIIMIDNASTDSTIHIGERYNCRIFSIVEGGFSHPLSCNLGAEHAHGEILVYLNGHSIPCTHHFLTAGGKNFSDEKIVGVYALPIPHIDGTLVDKILYAPMRYTLGKKYFVAHCKSPGLMGTTNCMIRKIAWEKYHFREDYNGGWGGEDADWAKHFIRDGYLCIHDPNIRAYHSHHLRWRDIFWQLENWRKMGNDNRDTIPEKQRKYF